MERATIEESQNALFKMLQEDPPSDTTDVEPEQKHDGDDGDDDDRPTPR